MYRIVIFICKTENKKFGYYYYFWLLFCGGQVKIKLGGLHIYVYIYIYCLMELITAQWL
jgi:hypothetical protein